MPEVDNKKKRRPLKNLPPDRFQPKVLFIWFAIFVAAMALLYWTPGRMTSPATLKIQQVVELAEGGKIKEGVIRPDASGGRDWAVVTGELKESIPEAPGSSTMTKQFRAAGRLTDSNMERLQKAQVFAEQPATTLLTQIAAQVVPFLIIIGLLYFLFVRQLKQAGRGALSFGKSRAKLLTRDRDKVTFADVAGCDEAKEEVAEVVEFLKDPKKFTKMGGRIPKGILMVGPPGTGKTLLAKAVAGEAEVPFFSISGSDFVEMFVGVGASRVRDMFEQGRKNAPCLIFIDEIDAVGRQRGAGLGGGNDEREQTLNSLLVEMDGFDTTEGVIIIAATNRPDVLDSALLRPGRFDRQIYVDLPDLVGREQILRVHARKISLAENVELSIIARGTPGLSGAELANLLNEAALLAARRNKKKVEMIDVDDAREKVQFGRERRRLMDDEEKKLTAFHEAGHALVQGVLDDGYLPVHKVTIIPRGRSLGSTMFIPKKDVLTHAKQRMLNQIAMGLGGRIAEETVLGDISSGAAGDIKQVTKIARHMVCDWGMSPLGPIAYGDNHDTVFLGREITRNEKYSEETARRIDEEIRRIIDEQYQRATQIITERRDALEKIANALIEFETIEGKHVLEILQHGNIQTPVFRDPLTKQDTKPVEKRPPEKNAAADTLPGSSPAPTPA
ncbi:ATP-dependent zinc metalloprotease FtsH [Horticoccus luteus]|uniref:ATP-dependent zinc metalloprotease FtsH n=1 Tax=Horticoccus luteus TaxID=2862869 RepID=A0A8F9TZ37_9BACT|nr:ATP-dependent zinc metalloprotease FtsH [Horticoccus luteus]QYM80403.1 ATP-dependent zinc metalloprotease FtsH [Horticoccus luteus]